MQVLSLREYPAYKDAAIAYFQAKWATPESAMVYEDCLSHALTSKVDLPQWYLLMDDLGQIVGCAGLIPNDFISRMDLCPWLCALYVEEAYRGQALGRLLIEKAESDARAFGYPALYLATDHIGYYEHYGYRYLATGYHPWGESSRIYCKELLL